MENSNIDVYDCNIKTLTPIHIGSGKNYLAAEYISVKAKNKSTKKLVNLIRRVSFDKYYQSLSEEDQYRFIESASNPNFKLSEFASTIKKDFRRYDCINKSDDIRNEIVEHIKTNDESYIPGSSLKGAIKTALLYNSFDYSDKNNIERLFRTSNRGDYIPRFENFTSTFFSSSQKRGKSAQFDISRFLQFSDSTTFERPDIHGIVSIMGKKNSYDGLEYYQRGRGQNIVESFLETIPMKTNLKSRISINYDSNIYNNDKLPSYVNLNLKSRENFIDMDTIKKCIYEFSKDIIEYEIEFLDKYGYGKGLEDVNLSLAKNYIALKKINKIKSPIIKLGAGSGFLAMTIGIKIKHYDSELFERIRNSLKGKNYYYEFPKSRKIIKKSKMPLGWVKLDITKREV